MMARTKKVVEAVEEKQPIDNSLIEVKSKHYTVVYLPNHSYVEFVNNTAKVTKEQYEVLKDMGVI